MKKLSRATGGQRFLSWLIDAIIVGIILNIISLFNLNGNVQLSEISTQFLEGIITAEQYFEAFNKTFYITVLIGLIVVFFYHVLLPTFWSGKTVGKALLGTQIVSINGKKASFGRLFVREILIKYILAAVTCLITNIISFFMITLGSEKRGIHDLVAGTMVIRKNNKKEEIIEEEISFR